MTTTTQQEPDLITIGELSARLGIGKTKTYQMLNSGQLPIRRIRLGEHWRFSRLEVERFCHGEFASNHSGDASEAA